jgi:hypothetical protein
MKRKPGSVCREVLHSFRKIGIVKLEKEFIVTSISTTKTKN